MDTPPIFLYVEDDIASIKIMKMVVEHVMNIKPLFIFQGSDRFSQKLDELEAPPDIFFLDIHMKPYSGIDLLYTLRNDKRYQKSKIIAVTASVMGEEVEMLKHSGFDGAIAKPLNIRQFPGLIERILRGEQVWHIS